jgi:hypothetical protein
MTHRFQELHSIGWRRVHPRSGVRAHAGARSARRYELFPVLADREDRNTNGSVISFLCSDAFGYRASIVAARIDGTVPSREVMTARACQQCRFGTSEDWVGQLSPVAPLLGLCSVSKASRRADGGVAKPVVQRSRTVEKQPEQALDKVGARVHEFVENDGNHGDPAGELDYRIEARSITASKESNLEMTFAGLRGGGSKAWWLRT